MSPGIEHSTRRVTVAPVCLTDRVGVSQRTFVAVHCIMKTESGHPTLQGCPPRDNFASSFAVTRRCFRGRNVAARAAPIYSIGMRLLFALSQLSNPCNAGFKRLEKSTLRAPQYACSKSRLMWNIFPISSAPGKPKLRYTSGGTSL